MAVDMQPKPGDYSINIPITFDYKGGRGQNKKWKIILGGIVSVLTIIFTIGILTNKDMAIWQRLGLGFAVFYIGLFIIRFFIVGELWFSDTYESLKETDFELKLDDIWNIFDIGPY